MCVMSYCVGNGHIWMFQRCWQSTYSVLSVLRCVGRMVTPQKCMVPGGSEKRGKGKEGLTKMDIMLTESTDVDRGECLYLLFLWEQRLFPWFCWRWAGDCSLCTTVNFLLILTLAVVCEAAFDGGACHILHSRADVCVQSWVYSWAHGPGGAARSDNLTGKTGERLPKL